jgi:hypothetical protein
MMDVTSVQWGSHAVSHCRHALVNHVGQLWRQAGIAHTATIRPSPQHH